MYIGSCSDKMLNKITTTLWVLLTERNAINDDLIQKLTGQSCFQIHPYVFAFLMFYRKQERKPSLTRAMLE
jgi:hypothetical protein